MSDVITSYSIHYTKLYESPGLDLNDVGFIDVVDRLRQETVVRYVENDPGEWFKEYQIRFEQRNHYVYDGTLVKHEYDLRGDFNTHSNWHIRITSYNVCYTKLLRFSAFRS